MTRFRGRKTTGQEKKMFFFCFFGVGRKEEGRILAGVAISLISAPTHSSSLSSGRREAPKNFL